MAQGNFFVPVLIGSAGQQAVPLPAGDNLQRTMARRGLQITVRTGDKTGQIVGGGITGHPRRLFFGFRP